MRALASLAAAAAVTSACGGGGEKPVPAGPRITVDGARSQPTRGSMVGFLHSLSAGEPPAGRVSPLGPRLWRSDLTRADPARARALGARYEVVLSDLWGYPPTGWGARGAPWRDLRRWGRFVRRVARSQRGRDVIWDVWNEPDSPAFWTGGRARLVRTYAVASRALEAELGPDVVIGGPSVARFSRRRLTAFLDGCRAAGCRVSYLSWHANPRPGESIGALSGRLRWARAALVDSGRYAALGLRSIQVNEYTGLSDRYRPGEAVAYLRALEHGGADLAARSCWSEAECSPRALDGLLTGARSRPRSVWWPVRWYAAGVAARVASAVDPAGSRASLAALASTTPAGGAQVLIGRADGRTATGKGVSGPVAPRLALRGLAHRAARARVLIRLAPATGPAALERPRLLLDETRPLRAGAMTLTLPPLRDHEAVLVTVAPAGG